jgi:hypothetical protein
MKGLTHFATGVAAASFFPAAVEAGAAGNPLFFILGGVFGLLPDTIDFKFRRFFSTYDMQVVPDPRNPDAQTIADGVAYAINKAHATGHSVGIKLHTIPLGPDTWRQYTVRFDVAAKQVVVEYGPAVTTGQIPLSDIAPEEEQAAAIAPLSCAVSLDYEARNVIDILDGPIFKMTPTRDGKVCPEFIPWHRTWTHSVVTASLLALAIAAIGALTMSPAAGILMGAVVFAAHSAHILGDQLGFMGSALLFPFVKKRTKGLGLMHSMESVPNFITIWTCCLLIFWNLYVAAPSYLPRFNLLQLIASGVILPYGLVALARRGARLSRRP